MLKVALMMTGPAERPVVADTFAAGDRLLIVDAEEGKLLRAIPRDGRSDRELAGEIAALDCEAVICGPIEQEPFVIIADEGCITRYHGAGLTLWDAVAQMNDYALPLIPDYIGGTGCHPGSADACARHGHEHL